MANIIRGEVLDLGVHLVQTDHVLVTSTVAEKWLATQRVNRVLNRHTVLAYRRDMIDGRWAFTGDPIRFDVDGCLIDGQHRLTALSLTEGYPKTLEFVVVRGLPPEAQLSMDQGRRRSSGQQLQLTGIKNSTSISAGVPADAVEHRPPVHPPLGRHGEHQHCQHPGLYAGQP